MYKAIYSIRQNKVVLSVFTDCTYIYQFTPYPRKNCNPVYVAINLANNVGF